MRTAQEPRKLEIDFLQSTFLIQANDEEKEEEEEKGEEKADTTFHRAGSRPPKISCIPKSSIHLVMTRDKGVRLM